jgi:hypothetical protein
MDRPLFDPGNKKVSGLTGLEKKIQRSNIKTIDSSP